MPGRTTVAVAICLLVAVGLALAVAVTGDDRSGDRASSHDGAAPSPAGRAAPPGSPGSPPGGDPSPPSSAPDLSSSGAPRSSAAPSAAVGAEMPRTPSGSPGATDYRLPEPSGSGEPLVGATPPATGTARGRLIAGFPTALGPPEGAEVDSSGLAVSGRRIQASLVLAGGEQSTILRHYREALTARGYVEAPSQGVENDPSLALRRGRSSVVVAIRDGRTYLLAHLRAGRP